MDRTPLVVFTPSPMAMDAEQKRDADGRFGSGGASAKSKQTREEKLRAEVQAGIRPKAEKPWQKSEKGFGGMTIPKRPWAAFGDSDIDPDRAASLQGEAGRQARQQARDCNTGRYRQ